MRIHIRDSSTLFHGRSRDASPIIPTNLQTSRNRPSINNNNNNNTINSINNNNHHHFGSSSHRPTRPESSHAHVHAASPVLVTEGSSEVKENNNNNSINNNSNSNNSSNNGSPHIVQPIAERAAAPAGDGSIVARSVSVGTSVSYTKSAESPSSASSIHSSTSTNINNDRTPIPYHSTAQPSASSSSSSSNVQQQQHLTGLSMDIDVSPVAHISSIKSIIVSRASHGHLLSTAAVRLYFNGVELANKRMLYDYGVGEGSIILLVLSYLDRTLHMPNSSSAAGAIKIEGAFPLYSALRAIVTSASEGLMSGLAPRLTLDGTGGTYLLKNPSKKHVAVFKARDEEPFAPHNPRGHVAPLGSDGLRSGVRSGEGYLREIAAYLLDHAGFAGVPLTAPVALQRKFFKDTAASASAAAASSSSSSSSSSAANTTATGVKLGSLQQFVEYDDLSSDVSSNLFPVDQVHKIVILDIRILNMDRNDANILLIRRRKKMQLQHTQSHSRPSRPQSPALPVRSPSPSPIHSNGAESPNQSPVASTRSLLLNKQPSTEGLATNNTDHSSSSSAEPPLGKWPSPVLGFTNNAPTFVPLVRSTSAAQRAERDRSLLTSFGMSPVNGPMAAPTLPSAAHSLSVMPLPPRALDDKLSSVISHLPPPLLNGLGPSSMFSSTGADSSLSQPAPELELIPIDHSYSLPHAIEICDLDCAWFNFDQLDEPLSAASRAYIDSLDVEKDIALLQSVLAIRSECLALMRVSYTLLKHATARSLTLADMVRVLLRLDMDKPSVLESICMEAVTKTEKLLAGKVTATKTRSPATGNSSLHPQSGNSNLTLNRSFSAMLASPLTRAQSDDIIIERLQRDLTKAHLISTHHNNNNNNNSNTSHTPPLVTADSPSNSSASAVPGFTFMTHSIFYENGVFSLFGEAINVFMNEFIPLLDAHLDTLAQQRQLLHPHNINNENNNNMSSRASFSSAAPTASGISLLRSSPPSVSEYDSGFVFATAEGSDVNVTLQPFSNNTPSPRTNSINAGSGGSGSGVVMPVALSPWSMKNALQQNRTST